MENKTTIEEMFLQAFQIKASEMKVGEIKDVSQTKIEILSFNEKEGVNEYKLIKKIVRKKDAVGYSVVNGGSKAIFSGNHLLFVLFEGKVNPCYIEVKNLRKFKKGYRVMNQQKEWIELDEPIAKGTSTAIFDFEVEDNHNYYSNGILSHNTMFGSPEVTTGGNALKFYASVRLDVRRSSQLKDGDEITGNLTRVKVVKNKVAPPFKVAEFDIMYGKGISKAGEIVDLGVEAGIIKKAGSWYSYGDTKLGQGRDSVKQLLEDNPELMEELEVKIKQQIA